MSYNHLQTLTTLNMSGVDITPIGGQQDRDSDYGVFKRVIDEGPKNDETQTYDPSLDPKNYPDKRLELNLSGVQQVFSKLDIP